MKLFDIEQVVLERTYFQTAPLEDLVNEKLFYTEKIGEIASLVNTLKEKETLDFLSVLSDEAKNKFEGLIVELEELYRIYNNYIEELSNRIDEHSM